MPDRVAGLRGRKPAVFPKGLQTLGAYLTTPLPAPVLPLDVSGNWTGWLMEGNGPDSTLTVNNGQPVGDCGFADMVHKIMADAAVAAETETFPDANETVTAYLAYDNGQDEGVIMSAMINAWFNSGFFGEKIDAYVSVPVAQIDAAMAMFGAVLLGVNLTDDADELFEQGQPWTVANGETPDPSDGHCILKVKSDAEFDTFVTWGAEQKATKEWSAACIEEAWVVVTTEAAKNAKLVLSALLADIRSLGGTSIPTPSPTPVPVPPVTPTPPQPPVTPPGPVPVSPPPGVIAEVEHLAEEVVEEVEEIIHDLTGAHVEDPE